MYERGDILDILAVTSYFTLMHFSNGFNQIVYFLRAVLWPVPMHNIVRYQKQNSDINHV